MILCEVSRLPQPNLKDVPKGLMRVKDIEDFWQQVLQLNVSTRALKQIDEACKTQIALLKLRGPR